MSVPDQFSKTPISAPVWLWVSYWLLMVFLILAGGGIYAVFTVMFSAQFWTYVTWRGAWRSDNAVAENGE